MQGQLDHALAAYRTSLALIEPLAARDPGNAEWQRDLIVSLVKLGGASGEHAHWARALAIAEALRARGALAPGDAWMIDDLQQKLRGPGAPRPGGA